MSTTIAEANVTKSDVKRCVLEIIRDDRDLLRELVAEVIEDIVMGEAIKEGMKSEESTLDETLAILRS